MTTAWPRVVAKCAELDVSFDQWQHGVGSIALGKRADGKYAATVGGVVLSIPRQVGKTFLVGMIIIALCLLHPGLTVLWSAHRARTATKTFGTLKGMTSRKKVAPHMLDPRNANGEQELRFRNGSVIMFGAREQGFGRGFDEVDIEVFDEAQILTEKALEDMVPAANQSRQPSGGLLFFMGTPPRPGDPGEEFANRRKKALAGKSKGMVYVEFSADSNADPDDPKAWAQANPSFPSRTPVESIERMRENLTDVASFRREGLGIWDDVSSRSLIRAAEWAALKVEPQDAPAEGTTVFAVKFSPDGKRVAAAAALRPDDGPIHVEAFGVRLMSEGTSGLVSWLAERWQSAARILVDGKAGAGDFVIELVKAGVLRRRIQVMSTDDVITAHSGFLRAVQEKDVTHLAQPGLDASVRVAGKRKIGNAGGWGWESVTPDGDVTALEAVTLARHGAATAKRKTGEGRSGAGNRTATTRRVGAR